MEGSMRIEQVLYVAEQAVRQWERKRSARDAAEDAWFMLFSLSARAGLLPEEVQGDFRELWDAYGGFSPTRVTKRMIREFLNGLCDTDFLRIERMTRAFLTSARCVASDVPV